MLKSLRNVLVITILSIGFSGVALASKEVPISKANCKVGSVTFTIHQILTGRITCDGETYTFHQENPSIREALISAKTGNLSFGFIGWETNNSDLYPQMIIEFKQIEIY